MAGVDLNLSGAVRRTNKGSVDFYYGGGDEAWANLAAAYAGIPSVIRNGKVFGVITAGVISEYWWNDASQLANGDEVPYAQGGTTLTPDQVDAIDNANSPNSGNPFATMADILAGVVYQGVWNATTNTPTLTSSVGTQGYYYVVSVAGTTNLNGITDWEIGDWAIFNGAVWQKVDNTDVTGGNTNITSINVAALQALQTGSTISTTTFYNVTNAVGSTRVLQVYAIANNTNVVSAIDLTTGEIGTYDITADVFISKSTPYVVITKTDYETAYTGGLLVTGTRYRVIDAISTGIFATPNEIDAVVLATSGNTIYEIAEYPEIQAWGLANDIYTGATYTAQIFQCGKVFTVADAAYYSVNNINQDFRPGTTVMFAEAGAADTVYLQVYSDGATFQTINVLLAGSASTNEYGDYDLATGVFTPYGGTYTPTLTPDGSICTAAALAADAIYSVSNGVMKLMIPIDCTFDFTSNGAIIDYTLPFGSIASSGGNVTFNLNPNSPSLPISGYEKNGQIVVTTKDIAFNDDLTIYATITIKLA